MDMDESQREKVLTDIVQHAGDFFVFGGSLTLGGLSCRWKGGKDRLFGWGSAAQVDPGVGRSRPGPPVHLSSSTHFSFPSLLPPFSIIALECTRLTLTPTGQNKWNQPCHMEKLSTENVLIVGNFGAAGILQESHFGKVGALASHYKQSNLGGGNSHISKDKPYL